VTARDKFNGIDAEFWDCRDAEYLAHVDPISALEDFVDVHRERGRSLEEVIREMGPFPVEAYRREPVTEQHIEDATDRALEAARESLEEESELGDPRDDHPMFKVDVLAKHRPAFVAVVRALAADGIVWQCAPSHSVELTPDDVIEILRVERPEWFEASPPAAPPEGA
jgi:hypothetical protein